MIFNWTEILTAAIESLPELHRDILTATMQLPGKRKALNYTEAARVWNLDRHEFDRQRTAALNAVRLFLIRHGITAPDHLAA